MDIAAAEFYKNNKYDLDFKNPETKEADWINSDQLGEMYKGFIKVNNILIITLVLHAENFSTILVNLVQILFGL